MLEIIYIYHKTDKMKKKEHTNKILDVSFLLFKCAHFVVIIVTIVRIVPEMLTISAADKKKSGHIYFSGNRKNVKKEMPNFSG